MFMVVLRHSMDDVPYRLCKTRREAEAVARRASVRKAYVYAQRLEIVGGDCVRDAEDIPPPWATKTLRPEDLKGIPRA